MNCDGCNKEMGVVEAQHWSVCLPCTKKRHRAVLARRCVCGRRGKHTRNATLCRAYSRVWWSCNVCLGTIKQEN